MDTISYCAVSCLLCSARAHCPTPRTAQSQPRHPTAHRSMNIMVRSTESSQCLVSYLQHHRPTFASRSCGLLLRSLRMCPRAGIHATPAANASPHAARHSLIQSGYVCPHKRLRHSPSRPATGHAPRTTSLYLGSRTSGALLLAPLKSRSSRGHKRANRHTISHLMQPTNA